MLLIKAKPVKAGDAKLQGLRADAYDSQLPEESFFHALLSFFRKTFAPQKWFGKVFPCFKTTEKKRWKGMKRWGALFLTLCLVFTMMLAPVQASACTTNLNTAVRKMNQLNASNVRWSWKDAQQKVGLQIIDTANDRIEAIIVESCRMAEKTNKEVEIAAIIVSMCVRCKAVSDVAREAAKLCGVEAVCEYIEVEIGGHTVKDDPLRVILV